jgi:hypothetical protein
MLVVCSPLHALHTLRAVQLARFGAFSPDAHRHAHCSSLGMRSKLVAVYATLACTFCCCASAAQTLEAFPDIEPSETTDASQSEVALESQDALPVPPEPPPQAPPSAQPVSWGAAAGPAGWQSQEDQRLDQSAAPKSEEWYGWQTLTADAVSLGLLFATAPDGGMVGLVGYLFASPVIHGVHARPEAAAGSMGIRVVAPLFGGAIGSAMCTDRDGMLPCISEVAAGVLMGASTAIIVDAAILARKPAAVSATQRSALRIAPTLAPVRGGAAFALAGRF